MGILVKPPLSVPVTSQGFTTILPNNLPSNFQYRIYAIDLSVIKGKEPIILLENNITRWQGIIEQKTNHRLDFGNLGWTLAVGATLELGIEKKTEVIVNILQYGIIEIRNT